MAHDNAEHTEHEPALLSPGSTFARYEIVRCIGVGGMGAVFEATHRMLRKRVALKTLHASLARSDAARQRFLREAETVARIRHPNVVDITDVGIEDGVPFLVMEFLEGEDLANLLVRLGSLAPQEAADIVVPVASGLLAVHRLGIVHRDLKPENVLLARDIHGDIVPKLIDFGVSKDLAASLRSGSPPLHTVTGTPHYMSPEQARGSASLDGRTDQYALGVLLYQILSGKRPYESDSLLELLHLIDTGEHKPLRTLRPEVPEAFEAVVHRAMARHARDRFETTEAFGRALLAFASERVRVQCERDFTGEGSRAAMSLEPGVAERLAAATLPARDPAVLSQTSSGVRIRMGEGGVSLGSRGARLLAWGVLMAALLGGGALLWTRTGEPDAIPANSPAARARESELAGPPTEAPPASAAPVSAFRLDLRVTPSDARIELDGRFVGVGQFAAELARDGRDHELRASAPGYMPRTLRFRDQAPADTALVLEAVEGQAPQAAAPGASSKLRAEKAPRPRAKSARSKRAEEPEVQSAPSLDIQLSR